MEDCTEAVDRECTNGLVQKMWQKEILIVMPIKPENREKYPKDWQQIRERILLRSGDTCEQCGVANYAVGARGLSGAWYNVDEIESMSCMDAEQIFGEYPKLIVVVLTIAHLCHDERCADESHLKAWCQKCHNSYDVPHRKRNAAVTSRAGPSKETASSATWCCWQNIKHTRERSDHFGQGDITMNIVEIKSFQDVVLFEMQRSGKELLVFSDIWKLCLHAAPYMPIEDGVQPVEPERFAKPFVRAILSDLGALSEPAVILIHSKDGGSKVSHITLTPHGRTVLAGTIFTHQDRMGS